MLMLISTMTGSLAFDILIAVAMLIMMILCLAPMIALYVWLFITIRKTRASYEKTVAEKQRFLEELTEYVNNNKVEITE